MERSGHQKALLVLSIIELVLSILGLVGGLAITFLGGAVIAAAPEVAAEGGATAAEVSSVGGMAVIASGVIIIAAIFGILAGVFGIRAANDNQKIMPVWVVTLIVIILNVVGLIVVIANGSFGGNAFGYVIDLVFSIILFWIANSIKTQAGK